MEEGSLMATTRLSAVLGQYADATKDMGKRRDAAYHAVDRGQGWDGFNKNYVPKEAEGVQLPPQNKLVTMNATEFWEEFKESYSKIMDAAATKDYANTTAKADVVVNGEVFMSDVPAPYLLWMDHALVDVRTFLNRMPTLPLDENWVHDKARGHHVSKVPEETAKTSPRNKPIVMYPHKIEGDKALPAQTQMVVETEVEGTWKTTKYHGGMERDTKKKYLANTQTLLAAVRAALAEANSAKVEKIEPAAKLFDFITAS
jgi:hypothetical protein